MSYQIVEIEEPTAEPVSVLEAKAYMLIDLDYVADDEDIKILISTARQRLEQYLNIGLAQRKIEVQWNGKELKMPYSPNGAIATIKDKDGTVLTTDKYTKTPYSAATLYINDRLASGYNYFYSTLNCDVEITRIPGEYVEQFYAVQYTTGYETAKIPKALKQAILAEIDYLQKLKGMPVTDKVSPNAATLAFGYSKNLPI